MMIRGQFDTDWNRADEVHGVDCSRNGDGVPCDFYFIVTDHLGKPAVMLDSQGRVTGAADYDPLGYPNRVTLHAKQTGTDRWYANNLAGSLVATMRQPVDTGTNVRVRPRFHVVDTEDGIGKTGDYVEFTDTQGQQLISDIVQGHHKGPVVGPWITTAQTTDVQVRLVSDEANCCPDSGSDRCDPHMACSYCPASYFSGTCNGANYPYLGVVVEGYEYQRYQQGAAPVWTPLRFPGHYYDEESDLFENWNRYYDPSIGRYLQPEPMMVVPQYVQAMAASGIQIGPYSYAANNPIAFTDSTGLAPDDSRTWEHHWNNVDRARNDHWNRNQNNREVPYDVASKDWIKMSDKESIYHRHGPGNENNEKFISPDGRCEQVYRDKQLVRDPANLGTYNYGPPITIGGKVAHFFLDVAPYWMWGNSRSDPVGPWNRVTGP